MPMTAFVQAKHFRAGGNTPITRIVIHDMEMSEKPDTAEACAAYFAKSDKVASAHYCVDNNSVVQCVHDDDVAFHAPPNTGSIGIEHAGYAHQSTGDWDDPYSRAMLEDVSAPLVRGLCDKYGIPKVWLTIQDLLDGKHGVTSHNNVSQAFHKSTHTDPGANFPVTQYMAWVNNDQGDDDMTPEQAEMLKQIHAVVAKSGYIEQIVQYVQKHAADPTKGGGPGAIDYAELEKELADAFPVLRLKA